MLAWFLLYVKKYTNMGSCGIIIMFINDFLIVSVEVKHESFW